MVMLRLLSRGLLVGALVLGYTAHHERLAYADDDEEEEEDDGGGDKGGDGEGDDEEGEGEGDDDKDQPPVTAGGLFTMTSYPVREISRPLTLTQGITQLRASAGTDLSAKGAFESGGLSLEAVYGQADNFNIIGGLTNAYNFKQFGFYAGFDAALAYDIVDFRLAANVHRNALPVYADFCNPPASPNEMPNGMGMCSDPATQQVQALPSGDYLAGSTQFSVDIGFPFRYAIKPEVAIIALYTLMQIDFNSAKTDHVTLSVEDDPNNPGKKKVRSANTGDGYKPDLNPSVGIATNPLPPLSVVIFAQLRIPEFDTSAGAFQVPVTGRIEFSPNQKFDLGLEFTLLNVKPPEGQSPIDNRFLALFIQSRFGK
ncbi:MAG TPA: hypothetical protein VMZ53_09235 [Kofleriaceae bacterium]|nr:hypothetical protein [Kofleriaceae bacterium]